MSDVIKFRPYKRMVRWENPEEEGRAYSRRFRSENTIVLPPEYDDYMKRFGRVYKIERSHSGYAWTLTVDRDTWGWDQKGDYVRTLTYNNGGWLKAFKRAKEIMPNEAAFWIEDGYVRHSLPGGAEYRAWWRKVKKGMKR